MSSPWILRKSKEGHLIHDRITALGTGIADAVKRITTTLMGG